MWAHRVAGAVALVHRVGVAAGPTGAPLLLLTTMLGLEPVGEHLLVDPALPSTIGRLEVLDIPGRWGRVDAFARGRVDTSPPARGRGTRQPA